MIEFLTVWHLLKSHPYFLIIIMNLDSFSYQKTYLLPYIIHIFLFKAYGVKKEYTFWTNFECAGVNHHAPLVRQTSATGSLWKQQDSHRGITHPGYRFPLLCNKAAQIAWKKTICYPLLFSWWFGDYFWSL